MNPQRKILATTAVAWQLDHESLANWRDDDVAPSPAARGLLRFDVLLHGGELSAGMLDALLQAESLARLPGRQGMARG